jgi:hypothetical protein
VSGRAVGASATSEWESTVLNRIPCAVAQSVTVQWIHAGGEILLAGQRRWQASFLWTTRPPSASYFRLEGHQSDGPVNVTAHPAAARIVVDRPPRPPTAECLPHTASPLPPSALTCTRTV